MKQGIKLTPLKKPFVTDLYKIEYRNFYFSAVTLRYWKSSGIDSNSNCQSITLQVCNSFTKISLKK
ncbi:hypothetical protein LEP1GSC043_0572 [Leptospira weilii str. Ecochallenge]|uniref:Uncharacterized protein n=1 Tax=Leptospira weilii str. Ecochallenge TaxID=1049986 RepID=N1UHC3_9LEPT|nr:hypothetical protein LEP1GSC043_0572 [Leptospira weilii str. Ecochallenge]